MRIVVLALLLIYMGCSKAQLTASNDSEILDIEDTAQQIGDVMASLDEIGGSTGSIAMEKSVQKTFARLAPGELSENAVAKIFLPNAQASSCAGQGFSTCSGGTVTRNFNGCSVGGAVFSGSVTMTWSAGTCSMPITNDFVERVPSFTVTGRRGATLSVSKSSTIGQKVTFTGGSGSGRSYSLFSDGIRRVFTNANNTIIFDKTTSTPAAIQVSGPSRDVRRINGTGTLQVKDNLKNVTCTYTPNDVRWVLGCNCPTSGTWTGTCSNGKSSNLRFTGCGSASYSEGGETTNVALDRCGS